jgi:TLC domain
MEEAWHVGTWCMAWTCLYMLIRYTLRRELSPAGALRVVALVYAAAGLTLPPLTVEFSQLRQDVGAANTEKQTASIRIMLGYFVFDTACCLVLELTRQTQVDWANHWHHAGSLASLSSGLWHQRSGHELLLGLLVATTSSPCVHTRAILQERGCAKTALAEANDMALAVVFMLFRNVPGPMLTYWTMTSRATPLLVKVGALSIQLVGWYWSAKIVGHLAKLAQQPSPKMT